MKEDLKEKNVKVRKDILTDYGYKGRDNFFIAIKQKEDDYSGIYNLIDSRGRIVYEVFEEDLIFV